MATVRVPLPILGAGLGTSQVPELVTVQTTPATPTPMYSVYAFTDAAIFSIYYDLIVRSYGSGNLTLTLDWYTPATTNNCVWQAQIGAYTANTDTGAVSAKTFATANTATCAARANANSLARHTITISNLDSLATDDHILLRVFRDPANGSDNLGNTAFLMGLELSYSDT
jgi:hypothetical protein